MQDKERDNTKPVFRFYTKPVTFYTKAFAVKIWYNKRGVSYNFLP